MDNHITSLKREAEQAVFVLEVVKEQSRMRLDDYDNQIAKLMSAKADDKMKFEWKLAEIKAEAEKKISEYNKLSDRTAKHTRMEHTFTAAAMNLSPVRRSAFSDTTGSEAEEDGTYYPSKAAEKRDAFTPRLQSHDILKNMNICTIECKSDSDQEPPRDSIVSIDDYPIIVPHPRQKDVWIQVYCPICTGNTRSDKFWFKGVMGAKRHMRLAHKEVCESHSNDVLFGTDSVSRLIERTYTAAELDDLKNGRIPAPKSKLGTNETVEESFLREDDIEAYAAYEKYPTIVRRADGEWVELRCSECKGNCIDGVYMQGVAGFRYHLEQDHDKPAPNGQFPEAWVVKQCEFQNITQYGMLGLMDDREDAQPPEKFNVGGSFRLLPGEDVDDGDGALTENSDSSKDIIRSNKLCNPFTDDEDSDVEEDNRSLGSSGNPLKRAREPKSTSLAHRSRKLPKEDHDPPSDEDFAVSYAFGGAEATGWADCCPCTLEGHDCQLHDKCTRAKVCMVPDHSKCALIDRSKGLTHTFTPLCTLFFLGLPCDAGTCDFSHDEACKSFLEGHDCDNH